MRFTSIWIGLMSSSATSYSHGARQWRLRSRTLDLTQRPQVMGILNVTPDSFSDGGEFFDSRAAIEHGLRLVAEGADLLDIGGESTRPYSEPVDAREELRRVLPVLEALSRQIGIPLSIDTSKAAVAREAVAAGVQIINDITGLLGDPAMIPLAAETGVGVCAMHIQGTPQTMQDHPTYTDIVEEVFAHLRERRTSLVASGIAEERIALDPGIGFGKTHQHNLTLLASCRRYHDLGGPLLVGPSRKGFIGKVLGDKNAQRLYGTIGVVLSLASQGVQIVRVHDVRAVREALALFAATGGLDGRAAELA